MAGNMQEKAINKYGDYTLFEKFENYYFRNNDSKVVSEEFQSVNHLIDMFFIVIKRGEAKVRDIAKLPWKS